SSGRVVEVRCTHDPATRAGQAPDGRRPKGTIHWVSAAHSVPATVHLYDHLFAEADASADATRFREALHPASRETLSGSRVEPSLAAAAPGTVFQFERLGYFCVDPASREGQPVLNRTVSLRDTWAKIEARTGRPTGNRTPV
ncbi:MAG: glutamine--tRNA ligase, partial [Candidatus Eiseniibacteriota bacterium]